MELKTPFHIHTLEFGVLLEGEKEGPGVYSRVCRKSFSHEGAAAACPGAQPGPVTPLDTHYLGTGLLKRATGGVASAPTYQEVKLMGG